MQYMLNGCSAYNISIVKHTSVTLNQGANALSRRHSLLFQLETYVLVFERVKALYEHNKGFKELLEKCQHKPTGEYPVHQGYLFMRIRLYTPKCRTRELLIREVREGAPASNYGRKKTISILKLHHY